MTQGTEADRLRIAAAQEFDAGWYRRRYPDVALSGMDPAAHYLRYGAEFGRDPGPGFQGGAYLRANPDVARAGWNPLLHYLAHGRAEGRAPQPAADDPETAAWHRVDTIRGRLYVLGLVAPALADWDWIRMADPSPAARALAARELAMWHMRQGRPAAAAPELDLAWRLAAAPELRARLVVLRLLCDHAQRRGAPGDTLWAGWERHGLIGTDALLARANFETDPGEKLVWINRALDLSGLAPVALGAGEAAPYNRLTTAAPLPAAGEEGPLVSVLVAAWNAAATLPAALRALSAQSWRALEILVIDDASTDGTAAQARAEAARDPRIRVIDMPENAGAYAARNRGLAEARGSFVTLHDADDWAHPARIETQMRHMLAHPDRIGCTSEQARARDDLGFLRFTGGGYLNIVNTSSLLVRRDPVVARLGGWDRVRVSADNELIRRIRHVFGAAAMADLPTGPLAFQRESAGSAVADSALGINGFRYGARREYHGAQRAFHEAADPAALRYADGGERPFPAPDILVKRPEPGDIPHFAEAVAGDFRLPGLALETARAAAGRAEGPAALVELFRYDLADRPLNDICPEARALIDGQRLRMLVFGETATAGRLTICDPAVLEHDQAFLPTLTAREVTVIVPHPPGGDAAGRGAWTPATCAARAAGFGGRLRWQPAGRGVRAALPTAWDLVPEGAAS